MTNGSVWYVTIDDSPAATYPIRCADPLDAICRAVRQHRPVGDVRCTAVHSFRSERCQRVAYLSTAGGAEPYAVILG